MASPKHSQMVRVAELYYEQYLGQREIGRILGKSTSTVSRLLAEARSASVVEIRIHRKLERNPELAERMRGSFGLRDVVVVCDGSTPDETMRNVGEAAAEMFLGIVEDGMTIGISWGSQPFHMVQALEDTPLRDVKVIQMAGSRGDGDPAVDGPEIALRLAEKLHGSYRYVHAPAVVETPDIRESLLRQPLIHEILTEASRADIMITGIGSIADEGSSLERAGYLSREERLEYLAEGAIGHILARMFDMQGKEIELYNRRVVAMDLEHLRGAPWSMCVCDSARKASAVSAALRGKLFNTLVINEGAARAVGAG